MGYFAFNLTGIIVGIVLILHRGVPRDLGVAIVVGSIFAFGSFIAQWWSIQVQRESDFYGRVDGSVTYQQHLGEMRNEINEIIDRLNGSEKTSE